MQLSWNENGTVCHIGDASYDILDPEVQIAFRRNLEAVRDESTQQDIRKHINQRGAPSKPRTWFSKLSKGKATMTRRDIELIATFCDVSVATLLAGKR